MEFSVKKFDLLEELELTQGVVERKTTIPILSNLLVRGQGQSPHDHRHRSRAEHSHSCEAKVKKEGAGTIPAKKLLELVRLLPDEEIHFKLLENHWMQITCDRKTYKMVGMSKDNFPALPAFPHALVKIPAKLLADADRQDHLCNFARGIALHAEWRAAGAEARLDHHGGHRRPSPGHGRDRSQI